MLLSLLPQTMINSAARSGNKSGVQLMLWLASLLGIVSCVLRVWDFRALNSDWTEHSYGSIVWALVFLHCIHLYTSTFETMLMAFALPRVPWDEKHRLDINVNCIYWFFVVGSWMVIYAVIWGAGRVL